ncbi:hypothetical protein [Desulfoluna spongiiphila]|uniref:hypothetical protein n=1 Tax=Desulfoluna spongiiphila TaxID=419481 RepID=UPI00125C1F26|nr:hypothetical protein [Desulfoluna spongiiphila]VVS92256.1 hypothetical protein DBB_18240 [Desulfoluna spongiiphila]
MKKWLIGIAAVLGLPLVAVALLWVCRNPIITYGLTHSAEALVGAEVSLEGVKAGPFGLTLAWERLVVADPDNPWKNVVETGSCRLTLAGPPLLKGCVVVESLTANEVSVGKGRRVKARSVDSSPRPESTPESLSLWLRRKLETDAKELPALSLGDRGSPEIVREVMAGVDFQTPGLVDRARADIKARVTRWQWRLRAHDYKGPLRAVGEALAGEDPTKAESTEALAALSEKGEGLKRDLKRMKGELRAERGAAEAEVAHLRRWASSYRGWVAQDVKGAVALVHTKAPDLQDVGGTLFSYHQAEMLIPMVARLESLGALICALQEDGAESGEPPRPWPRLWVRHADLEINAGSYLLQGTVTGLSSRESKTGDPFTFHLQGEPSLQAGNMEVKGDVSCRADVYRQGVTVRAGGIPQGEMVLAPGVHLTGGEVDVTVAYRARGEEVRVESLLAVTGGEVTGDGGEFRWFQQALKGALGRVPALEVESVVTFVGGEGRWDLVSNVDAYLAIRFDEAVARETKRLTQGLKAEVERHLSRHGMVLEEELAVAEQRILSPLEFLEESLRREELAVDRFLAGVDKERAKRQQVIEEKGMDALMKWKY